MRGLTFIAILTSAGVLCATSAVATGYDAGCDDPDGTGYRWVTNYGSVMRADLVAPNSDEAERVIMLHCQSNQALIAENSPYLLREFYKMATSKRRFTLDAVERYLREQPGFIERIAWNPDTCLCDEATQSLAFQEDPRTPQSRQKVEK
ncbi:hypothetical protein MHM88_16820 [Epibacterium sp. MM17-32]|uniref:hypothetical protein n=1 Tax=Epibacterium sp. MM17-32 TaxID=2917734 RepID=UPI001EF4DA89|nr:hypothetical protein [Epibacterium sp. MM17-32]MCG7629475.1 hypothetical protein [Epibacterium sp. MM17-32]